MRTTVNTLIVSLAVLAASTAAAQTAADPTGHWEGTVTAPMVQIDFEVDVARDASGTLVAAYGQKGTGARGLPLTQVTLDGRTFSFVLFGGGAGGGAFTGEILADGKTISGEARAPIGAAPFMLYRTGDAVMPRAITNTAVSAALEGRWTGALDVGGRQIGLVLTIANRPDGTASAAWAGTLDGDALKGTSTQAGGSLPLTFTRTR